MPLVNRTIPNLVQGVSQQPEVLRLPSQATTQENGYSSVVEGLKKRPPTSHIAKISTGTLSNAYIHAINRDSTERYIISISSGAIKVFTTAGVEKTVVNQTNATNYLTSSNPKQDFVAMTVADYTFILNKDKTTAMAGTTSPAKIEQAVYSVLQGVADTKYSVTIDGTTYNYTTGSSTTSTETIRDGLFSAVGSPTNITCTKIGNSSFSIVKSTGTLTVSASDGYGDDASQIVADTVQTFSDLPSPAIDNMIVEVTGDNSNQFDNYFVKYSSSKDAWVETVKPAIKTTIDNTTMPHVLIRTADGNFRFTQVDGSTYTISSTDYDVPAWGTRVAGDLTSAPDPTFIGRKLNDIFFHRNRLGFVADENVIMSRAGEFYEFFPETVVTVLDTDPLDVASTHSKVSILRHVVSFAEELLLFSDHTQFMLTGGTTLTAKNVAINVATEFEIDKHVKPVGSGNNVFFAFPKGNFTGFREFFVEDTTDVKKADDITANVPKYIPSNVFKIAVATNENVVVALSSSEQNSLFIHQFFSAEQKKLQSAWHKWTFGASATETILGMDFIENLLYLVIQRSDGVYLESLDISPAVVDTSASYLTHLDRKISNSTSGVSESYNSGTNQTTITIPYTKTNTLSLVGASTGSNTAGQEIAIVSQSGTSVVVSGDITSYDYYIGEDYTFKFTFSQQFMQIADTTGSRIATKEGRLQIRNWSVSYNDTAYFTTKVEPVGRSASNSTFTGTVVGSGLAGTVNLEDGDYTFAVQSENDKLTVTLENNSHLPSNFINASWEGYYVVASQRV
tara:strand:+ start:3795 stop:6170 length:2376 start_codon:yes stop_codon:yes gene_type:complete